MILCILRVATDFASRAVGLVYYAGGCLPKAGCYTLVYAVFTYVLSATSGKFRRSHSRLRRQSENACPNVASYSNVDQYPKLVNATGQPQNLLV
jgi:hypothetical protein